ncbi:hypothetical protein BGZ99_001810 [Dissophora globulifera]|uniref:Uncharacterized protein n=1 Tax=Dissophora globulifera TaxID=979702 RepID=A0A9P6QXH0_9FUNG|nr:hypothetical protein BGZ99_001810 [Dissophora globulifera]
MSPTTSMHMKLDNESLELARAALGIKEPLNPVPVNRNHFEAVAGLRTGALRDALVIHDESTPGRAYRRSSAEAIPVDHWLLRPMANEIYDFLISKRGMFSEMLIVPTGPKMVLIVNQLFTLP